MKLNNKQVDALAYEIKEKLSKKRNLKKEKEDYVSNYLKIIKDSGLLDQINELFNSQLLQTISLNLSELFNIIGIDEPRYYGTNVIRRDYVEENLERIILDSYKENIPTLSEIKNKLILESIVVNEDESIEDFINKMVQKFE